MSLQHKAPHLLYRTTKTKIIIYLPKYTPTIKLTSKLGRKETNYSFDVRQNLSCSAAGKKGSLRMTFAVPCEKRGAFNCPVEKKSWEHITPGLPASGTRQSLLLGKSRDASIRAIQPCIYLSPAHFLCCTEQSKLKFQIVFLQETLQRPVKHSNC